MQGGYKLAFDVANRPFFEVWMAPLIILPVVGLLLVIVPRPVLDRFLRGPKGALGTAFNWFFFLFTSLITGFWLLGHLTQRNELRQAEKDGSYRTAEGCLQKFHPMPGDGHDTERLKVAGKYFIYSDYISTNGFNQTESHGGPIHPDSKVRLTYAGNEIIRVETQDHACPPAPDLPRQEAPGDE